jgi:HK97 gp10 family phage protein
MEITFRFEGFEEVRNAVEALASDSEVGALNKRIFERSADITEPKMKAHMARSADNSKSGKKGYRPPGHAADNIPKKATAKKGEVGWELNGDAENWFYMKFVEWGTSKMPPRDFLDNTKSECESEYHMIAEEEYQKKLSEKLGD